MLFNTVHRPLDIILWFVLLSALAGCESAPVPERQGAAGRDRNILFELGGSGRVVDGTLSRFDDAGKEIVASNRADSLYTLEEGGDSLWVLATSAPVEPRGEKASRAAQSQTLADAGSFTVWSWMWQKANTANSYYYIAGTEVLEESDGIWAPVREYPWPGKAYEMVFYAVAPHGVVTTMARTTTARTSFTYTVQPDPADQPDLMAAYTATPVEGDHGAPANLEFNHILSAIKVVTGDDFQTATVSSVKFKGIKSKGEYVYGSGWTDITDPVTYEVQPGTSVPSTPGSAIVDGASTLMLMPQQLSGAEIEITLTDANSGVTRTLSTTLSGDWLAGCVYTYRVSTTQIVKEVTLSAKAPEWDYTGAVANGQTRLEITSTYRWKDGNGYLTPSASEPWTAQWVDDQGNPATTPTWLRNTPTAGPGGTSQSYNVTCTVQSAVTSNPHNDNLKNAAAVSNYDLSTKGGTEQRNTANCYIVNGPGTYLIPLVYGNAIKNGATNASSYSTTANVNLKNLINHNGAAITSPWIEDNNNCTAANTTLIWQDVKNMISVNGGLYSSGGRKYVKFTVSASNIKQGNALIAVRNSSNVVMWSWHVWVTDYVPGLAPDKGDMLRDKTIGRYDFMPLLLGFCYPDGISYPKREAKLHVTAGGSTLDVDFVSHLGVGSIAGRATYYQWGRKDPMLPATDNSRFVTAYNSSGGAFTFQKVSRTVAGTNLSIRNQDIALDIQHPGQFNMTSDLYGYYANNLWNITGVQMRDGNAALNNPIRGIKTVYDPTPAGYQMPTYHQLREFGNNIVYDATKIALVYTVGGWTIRLPLLGHCSNGTPGLYGTTCIAQSCVTTAQRPSGNPYSLMMNVRNTLTQNSTNDRGNPPSKWWGEAGNINTGNYTILPVREL